MAKLEIYLCDGCGIESPDGGQIWCEHGWYHINASFDRETRTLPRYYACSLDCLVAVARQLRGDVVMPVDALEALFAEPAAVKPVTKPRPPRKPRDAG